MLNERGEERRERRGGREKREEVVEGREYERERERERPFGTIRAKPSMQIGLHGIMMLEKGYQPHK